MVSLVQQDGVGNEGGRKCSGFVPKRRAGRFASWRLAWASFEEQWWWMAVRPSAWSRPLRRSLASKLADCEAYEVI